MSLSIQSWRYLLSIPVFHMRNHKVKVIGWMYGTALFSTDLPGQWPPADKYYGIGVVGCI